MKKKIELIMAVCLVIAAFFLGSQSAILVQNSHVDTGELPDTPGTDSVSNTELAGNGQNESSSDGLSIVIDAGHGGIDPGKVGINDALEKDINLALALKLRDKFSQDSIRIILTRDSDTGLYSEGSTNKKAEDMQTRCKIISDASPIFTVSLHQNSYPSPEVCGAQVFYFGQSQDGKKLADMIQDSLISNVDPDNHRVAKANESYYLLKKTPTPTVIVECGFLSNPTEADLLLTDDYQNQLVDAIYNGIQNYLSEST
jgi:N-acetylmuramoyl-L-alanine amidase